MNIRSIRGRAAGRAILVALGICTFQESRFDLVWLVLPRLTEINEVSIYSLSLRNLLRELPLVPVLFVYHGDLPEQVKQILKSSRVQLLGQIDIATEKSFWLGDAIHLSRRSLVHKEVQRQPIVKILHSGGDSGIRLNVNGNEVKLNQSHISKVLNVLLSNSNQIVSWEEIQKRINHSETIPLNDRKNWTKRLRTFIESIWLKGQKATSDAKVILESSSHGLQLNADVIR